MNWLSLTLFYRRDFLFVWIFSFTQNILYSLIDIDETDNVKDLIKKLLSDDRTVIVTTIQKMNHVMRRFSDKEGTKRFT